MARPSKYTPELRERAVRMLMEPRPDYPHETAAIESVASKLRITTPGPYPLSRTGEVAALRERGLDCGVHAT